MIQSPVWHPFTQHGLGEPIPLVESASGAILYTRDGRRVIDGISSWWVTTHGHCHPKIMAAIAEQAQKLDQVIFAGWTHEPAERLARELLKLVPVGLDYVFYTDSGSTSVEVALKMALGFWANRGEARHRVIVMDRSYHGDTIGAMSVGARGVFNTPYSPLLFDVDRIPFPAEGHEQQCIDALQRHCRNGDAAAFIVEPLILGAGGMLVYPPRVLCELRRVCSEHGVLFIADEVMTGWGRTGTLFACEQAEVLPDIMCLSKGITGGAVPLAVTLATGAIYDAHWSEDASRQFFHSSSYTANPLACAAALANVGIWRDEPTIERIEGIIRQEAARLERLARLPGVSGVRQLGTIIAVDVLASSGVHYLSQIGLDLRRIFSAANVLIRPLGNTIYLMPPYSIQAPDLDLLFEAIEEAIRDVTGKSATG